MFENKKICSVFFATRKSIFRLVQTLKMLKHPSPKHPKSHQHSALKNSRHTWFVLLQERSVRHQLKILFNHNGRNK